MMCQRFIICCILMLMLVVGIVIGYLLNIMMLINIVHHCPAVVSCIIIILELGMLIPKKSKELKGVKRYAKRITCNCIMLYRAVTRGVQVGLSRGRSDVLHNRKYKEMQSRVQDIDWSSARFLSTEKIKGDSLRKGGRNVKT